MASPFLSIADSTTSTEGHGDAFLGFVEYARSMLSSDAEEDPDAGGGGDPPIPPWSWVVSKIVKSCMAYSSGVTPAILLSDLFQILKKGREVYLTGCCLRTAMEGSGQPRLLPTEYLVVLLDEVIFTH
ncbi:hypothetical protein BHM03_00029388 [Ensete ventricosum]|nr:hypothetical protein BHM03_00029388 [Ensete ventricosum]